MKIYLVLLLCGFAAVRGSGESSAAGGAKSPDAVVLTVNGINYTQRDCAAYQRMMLALYRNKHPNISEDRLKSVKDRMRITHRSELIAQALMYSNLCTNKFTVTDEIRKGLEADYCRAFCHKRQTFQDLREYLQDIELDEVFASHYGRDLQVRAALETLYHDELAVSEADVTNAIENVKAYNRTAAATNALICLTITNVLQRLKAGEDFAKLADRFSQDPDKEPGGVLEDCDETSLSEYGEAYIARIARMKPGEVTGVMETHEGYEIVRKIADVKDDDDGNDAVNWKLARIFFRRPYFMPEVFDDKFRHDLKKERLQTLLHRIQTEFRRRAKISSPQGTGSAPIK